MVFVAPGAPFQHSPSPSSQACAGAHPECISGSPNRPDAQPRVNFSLIRPGPAGRSPARDAPRSCHEAGARWSLSIFSISSCYFNACLYNSL